MIDLSSVFDSLKAAFPHASIDIIPNPSPSKQASLLVASSDFFEIASWLRDRPEHAFDYLSNVSGVDYLDRQIKQKKQGENEEIIPKTIPGYLEVVYHLYSIKHRRGPLILRMHTKNRSDQVHLPSITSLWRSAEFQEREVFDLYGVCFDGHPDLRRLLMWDEFEGHPMRKDYVDPDDYEYEPTPHDEVKDRASQHLLKKEDNNFTNAESSESNSSSSNSNSSESNSESESSFSNSSNSNSSESNLSSSDYEVSDSDSYIIKDREGEDDLLEIAMGPQHPSTHGVFQMNVTLDGERVVKLKPVFGYLHRNHEKIAEGTTYLGSMPYTDRLDYFNSMTSNWAYALSVERLAGIAPTERAEHLRVIVSELTRLLNHTCLIGFLVMDMGALGTPLMYAFREREKILDLFESLSGSRMMCNYMRFGGCRCDLPKGWTEDAKMLISGFEAFLDAYEKLLTENEILIARTQEVGILHADLAINAGVSGPMLRASGVNYDLRKIDQYGIYDRFDFQIPLGEKGDVYDRYMIRILEMRESLKILQQAFHALPEGPIINPKARLRGFRPKVGEAYGRIEAPKGELGFYLMSDGSPRPYRYRVRPPSLINLSILEDMCLGHSVADVVVILGSVDIVLGEVDR